MEQGSHHPCTLVKAVPTEVLTSLLSLKTGVYFVNAPVAKGEYTHTLFSSPDPTWHKNVRRAMNPFFTQTAVLTYEPFVERTIEAFVTEMDHRFVNKHGSEGTIDFHIWLSFFTFDVISDMTYNKRHGFLSRGEDMYGIIGFVANFLDYGFIVSLFCVLALLYSLGSRTYLYRWVKCPRWIYSSGITLF